jgi:hypothetical protein
MIVSVGGVSIFFDPASLVLQAVRHLINPNNLDFGQGKNHSYNECNVKIFKHAKRPKTGLYVPKNLQHHSM